MLNAAYGMLAMPPLVLWAGRVRDGGAMTPSPADPIAESSSSTINPDAPGRRAASGRLATMAKRLRARRRENAVSLENSKPGYR
jgi:hypothetical protein